jgi:hypothetical protein
MLLDGGLFISILTIGFVLGYGARASISRHHRSEARRKRLL